MRATLEFSVTGGAYRDLASAAEEQACALLGVSREQLSECGDMEMSIEPHQKDVGQYTAEITMRVRHDAVMRLQKERS